MSRNQADLGITAAVAVFTCAAALADAPVALMTILGLLLFAAPGYLMGQVLFGSYSAGLERIVVATGLVFCVPILGGLLLYAAGLPLDRTTWLSLLAGVTLGCDAVLFVRRRAWRSASLGHQVGWHLPPRQVAAFGAAALIAVCAVGLAHAGVAMQHYSGYTQLWLDRPSRNASTVNLGVGNDEGKTVRYKLVLFRRNQIASTWTLDLPNGQGWQRAVTFTGRYTITAKLYRLPDVSSAYRYVVMDRNGKQARD